MDKMANSRARDPIRREAYLLKQLKSIYAWRGSLVDTVIENLIIPRIKMKQLPSEEKVIDFSEKLMDKQLEFGRLKKHRLPNMTKSAAEDAYCAFYDLEYNGRLDEEQLEKAKEEVILSLKNLVHSDLLKEIIDNNRYVIAQRSLRFQYADTNISCTPDLVVFYNDNPPLVVDWKVHAFANTDYRLQLGIYSFALSKINPHRDFPNGSEEKIKDPTKIRLIEYQLLKNKLREHSIDASDVLGIENYIFQSIMKINRLTKGKKYNELEINQFKTAISPSICGRCQFKKLCWTGGIFETN